jgi:hypothetical protein
LIEFAFGAAAFVILFAVIWVVGNRKFNRQKQLLAQRRPSPPRDEFIAMLASDCEADVVELMWDELLVFYRPDMTPHPDDDFLNDLAIDDEESNDWLATFCKRNELREKDISDWSKGAPSTIREFARWLSKNRQGLLQS